MLWCCFTFSIASFSFDVCSVFLVVILSTQNNVQKTFNSCQAASALSFFLKLEAG